MYATIRKIRKNVPTWLWLFWGIAIIGLVVGGSFAGLENIIATIITITVGAIFICEQIEQGNDQIRQKNKNFKLDKFEKRAARSMKSIWIKGVDEGCLDFSKHSDHKWICSWKSDKRSTNILIKIIRSENHESDAFEYLRNEKIEDRWHHRIAIHFDENHSFESEIIHLDWKSRHIYDLDEYEYACVVQALRHLQIMDRAEIEGYSRTLHERGIKKANDAYVEVPILVNLLNLNQIYHVDGDD